MMNKFWNAGWEQFRNSGFKYRPSGDGKIVLYVDKTGVTRQMLKRDWKTNKAKWAKQ